MTDDQREIQHKLRVLQHADKIGMVMPLSGSISSIRNARCGSSLPTVLRARFQKLVEEGLSGRAAALRLKLSPATGARWGFAIWHA